MLDEKFVMRFNSEGKKFSREEIEELYNNMPSLRVGMLFSLIDFIKANPKVRIKFNYLGGFKEI